MADYFPFQAGRVYEYLHTGSELAASVRAVLKLLSVSEIDGKTVARASLETDAGGANHAREFNIWRDARGVYSAGGVITGGRIEFPLPPAKGLKWDEHPMANEIASLLAEIKTPAGAFRNCLLITSLIAGGDAGCAERYYADGVGLVYEKYSGEERFDEVLLQSFTTN